MNTHQHAWEPAGEASLFKCHCGAESIQFTQATKAYVKSTGCPECGDAMSHVWPSFSIACQTCLQRRLEAIVMLPNFS